MASTGTEIKRDRLKLKLNRTQWNRAQPTGTISLNIRVMN